MMDFNLLGGISDEEAARQIEERNPFYGRFLIYNDEHPNSLEIRQLLKKPETPKHLFKDMVGATQRVYEFPNGKGASVVRASFTFHSWELAELEFTNTSPRKQLPKKKRIRKKWYKRYTIMREVVSEMYRYTDYKDVERHLLKLYNR